MFVEIIIQDFKLTVDSMGNSSGAGCGDELEPFQSHFKALDECTGLILDCYYMILWFYSERF